MSNRAANVPQPLQPGLHLFCVSRAFLCCSMLANRICSFLSVNLTKKMNIANILTINTYSPSYNAYTERTIWLVRPYRLTYAGATRILKRDNLLCGGCVVRLETALLA